MADLLVRDGTVVDGTGAPAVRADVRVRAGRIVEVALGLRPDGEPELDASGALVTPGFIDIEGNQADLAVFALDELTWAADEFVEDLPAGGARLRRPAGRYRATVVGGVPTTEAGKDTGARPGTVLRAGHESRGTG
jgi:N-acyl-D-aspartate/D-glutamate deacylase